MRAILRCGGSRVRKEGRREAKGKAMPPQQAQGVIREMDAYAPPEGLGPGDLVHIKVLFVPHSPFRPHFLFTPFHTSSDTTSSWCIRTRMVATPTAGPCPEERLAQTRRNVFCDYWQLPALPRALSLQHQPAHTYTPSHVLWPNPSNCIHTVVTD